MVMAIFDYYKEAKKHGEGGIVFCSKQKKKESALLQGYESAAKTPCMKSRSI